MSERPPVAWRPTHAQLRAVSVSAVLVVLAVLARRPDLAVLGAPFGVVAVWGALRRPAARAGGPVVRLVEDTPMLLEGQATRVRVRLENAGRVDQVVVVLPRHRWFEYDPVNGVRVVPGGGEVVETGIDVRALRWGRHHLDRAFVVGTSVLGAYRTDPLRTDGAPMTTWPLRDRFGAVDAVPRPAGLVGLHRSRRTGDGTEIAGVRAFRPGDRLRQINWAVSARTGTLHVTSTWSDRDTEVWLLLDTHDDVGASAGIDGTASSLDTAVRAAAAVAEHYLRHGDRVRLSDTAAIVRSVRSGSGRGHLRRILDSLVDANPHAPTSGGPRRPVRHRPARSGTLVIVLSPLLRDDLLGDVVTLVHGGCTVVVVDTLPADVTRFSPGEPTLSLAWRLRLLERAADVDRLGDLGVPTVPWRGPGTLDEVLRDVSRLTAAPRLR
jgi:uncharacterized protein (DUF58 family)